MKITKTQIKQVIQEELEIVLSERKRAGILAALRKVVASWDPETSEGKKYEADVESLLRRFGK